MTTAAPEQPTTGAERRPRRRSSPQLTARGEPMLWLTGGALATCVLMILGFLLWIAMLGFSTFWPGEVVRVRTVDGETVLGEPFREDSYRIEATAVAALDDAIRPHAERAIAAGGGEVDRTMLRTGNYDLTGEHFAWVDGFRVASEDLPEWAVVIERLEWGRFYGFPAAYVVLTPLTAAAEAKAGGAGLAEQRVAARNEWQRILAAAEPGADLALFVERWEGESKREFLVPADELPAGEMPVAVARVWRGHEAAWAEFERRHSEVRELWHRKRRLEKVDIGEVNERKEDARLRFRQAVLDHAPSAPWVATYEQINEARVGGDADYVAVLEKRLAQIEADFGAPSAEFRQVTAEIERIEAECQADYDRISDRIAALDRQMQPHLLYLQTADPGKDKFLRLAEIVSAYPANQVGFGDKLGIYFERWAEFLSDEPREANSEGGVFPAIFGTVLMTLLMCLVVVPFGVLAALYLREYAKAGPVISTVRIAVNNLAGVPSIVFGVFGLGFFCYIVGAGIDDLFYRARQPQPTFAKGGVLWASLTLALMTLPVVIVATEEALAAVPNSMREGSYACGASKWQTIRRIVLPRAMPGIMTGAILAMARGAGEVAPLMLVGAVKLAPDLPISSSPPFGVNQSFMHLGFHIYDLGFQSQNSEAAKGMVYTTTLLLIVIIAALNLTAVWLRGRLQRKFVASHF